MGTETDQIMETVCDLCHWPYVYQDEDVMHAEKCSFCQAADNTRRLIRLVAWCRTWAMISIAAAAVSTVLYFVR